MEDLMIKIDNVTKQYRLGAIGGGTLQGDIQSWWAKVRGKEDPNSIIGSKTYKKNEKFLALNGVSFDVKKGERVGIIGHNGAGKSTLLKLLSRVTAPTDGNICLNGRVASMLEVGTGFHGELTGRENIYMNGAILGMTKAEIDSKIDDIIEFSECGKFIDTPVKRYSSGMYVKLAFSVAAHLDSEIMIMDEVLAVGDMAFQKKCLEKMSQVSATEGRTILYVSHNMNTIRQLCERVVVLDHGKVIYDGDVETAINFYLKNEANNDIYIDYSDIPRISWLKNTSIRTVAASFIDKEDNVFKSDEKLKIKIKWLNEKDVKNVCLRVEIKNRDKVTVGTSILEHFYSGKSGEYGAISLEVPHPFLVSGEYLMRFAFYNKDDLGHQQEYDIVDGMWFTINTQDKLAWSPQAWGYFQFPDLKII